MPDWQNLARIRHDELQGYLEDNDGYCVGQLSSIACLALEASHQGIRGNSKFDDNSMANFNT